MFGSNPFGECPESVPVNFELICFDTDQLIRDMSMFLNFVLKLDIYDLRTQLKENVYGGHGYSIQKYYYLINYYKVPFHSLEYVVPSAVFPSFGKEQQSIYILNLSTAVIYLCFAQPFIPYDYNDLIEQESLGEVPISPLKYNDLFSLSDAIPSCFLLLKNEQEQEQEQEHETDFDISPDHWIISTWVETITQLCLAKIHKNIHERIQQSLPNSGIVFFTKMMELVNDEFSVLKGFPAAQERVTEITDRLNSNLKAGSGNLMDVAIELSEDYPFKRFIGQMFTVLQKAYDELKQNASAYLVDSKISCDKVYNSDKRKKRKKNRDQYREKKRSKSLKDVVSDFDSHHLQPESNIKLTGFQVENPTSQISENNLEASSLKKIDNISSFLSSVKSPNNPFPNDKNVPSYTTNGSEISSVKVNETIHVWKSDNNTQKLSSLNQNRQTDIANSVKEIFNQDFSLIEKGKRICAENELNDTTQAQKVGSSKTLDKIKYAETLQSKTLSKSKLFRDPISKEQAAQKQKPNKLADINKSTVIPSAIFEQRALHSKEGLLRHSMSHVENEPSISNPKTSSQRLSKATSDELKIPQYLDKLDIPVGAPYEAWRNAIIKSYTQFLKSV